ncbi:MAG: hypothetical protein JWP44_1515 [Mucilaginibacter sp.]|nr:hypothetical protein [Mucilaginibacter sp.]
MYVSFVKEKIYLLTNIYYQVKSGPTAYSIGCIQDKAAAFHRLYS